jgi:hypothetical protein
MLGSHEGEGPPQNGNLYVEHDVTDLGEYV